ncbi:MAG: glycosyltransferase family 9 protein [Alphaproteobacteria bacterium]|nr:glycosyltransferase family 9 protein [Alphaproteobacteria bacterium]
MTADAVLVIKHGALGDIVQAFDSFAAIRAHHPERRVVLLTTPAFAAFAGTMPWFDDVWEDKRERWALGAWLRLRRRLRGGRFAHVYDLQCSTRTGLYFRLLGPGRRPDWSGHAPGCSHPLPAMTGLHNRDRMAAQLDAAGIAHVPAADLDWLVGDLGSFDLAERFVLMVPGSSPHRPGKRWPAERYGALARRLAARGLATVLVGTAADATAIGAIRTLAPEALDLAGRTSLADLASLARRAVAAIGNDTGPMHLIDRVGCPVLTLMSPTETEIAGTAPRGAGSRWLARDDLAALDLEAVDQALASLLPAAP